MKVSRSNQPAQTLSNKIGRKTIVLKHRLQRREGVWGKDAKSLLIDSLLRGYIVNPVYMISEGKNQYVIDGVQRLDTVFSYLNDAFALSKNLKSVEIEGETYEISGKKFSKLDEPVQDALREAQITVYDITEYTDKDVREMFARINAGKPLNTVQRMTPIMSDYFSDAVSAIIEHPFFEKILTSAQLKSSLDQSIAIEVLMLSADSNDDYTLSSFSRKDKENFITYANFKDLKEEVELVQQALNKLDETFDIDVKMPKTSISFIIYITCKAIKEKKGMAKTMNAIKKFLDEYDSNEEYKGYIVSGTSSSDSVIKRQAYWKNIFKNL